MKKVRFLLLKEIKDWSQLSVTFIRVFHGQDIYKSVEEKGANFLYLIVKNHVFADGNKRIAATLFIYFLKFYGILYKKGNQVIDNNTLTALTLLIAESNPKKKDVIIDLVMNFLNKEYSSLKLKLKSWSILPISGMKKLCRVQQMCSAIYYFRSIKAYRFF